MLHRQNRIEPDASPPDTTAVPCRVVLGAAGMDRGALFNQHSLTACQIASIPPPFESQDL